MSKELKPLTHFEFGDCEEKARLYPDTFEIPSKQEIADLKVGDYVKLFFVHNPTERMWVKIDAIYNNHSFTGTLANDPIFIHIVKFGDRFAFHAKHIANILKGDE